MHNEFLNFFPPHFFDRFRASHPKSGRVLELYSDQPGVQFYTANSMPDPNNQVNLLPQPILSELQMNTSHKSEINIFSVAIDLSEW